MEIVFLLQKEQYNGLRLDIWLLITRYNILEDAIPHVYIAHVNNRYMCACVIAFIIQI